MAVKINTTCHPAMEVGTEHGATLKGGFEWGDRERLRHKMEALTLYRTTSTITTFNYII